MIKMVLDIIIRIESLDPGVMVGSGCYGRIRIRFSKYNRIRIRSEHRGLKIPLKLNFLQYLLTKVIKQYQNNNYINLYVERQK